MPPLMVSVSDTETRLAIASARAPGGSEVKATLDLLKSLTLKGCTVTADALHCHPAMAEAVHAAKAHYALRLKASHGPLFTATQAAFAAAGALAFFEKTERVSLSAKLRSADLRQRSKNSFIP
jgi:predicted transposase YbfD/YdcC